MQMYCKISVKKKQKTLYYTDMQGSRAFLVLNILVWYRQASFVVYCIYDYEHFGCFLYSRVCGCICSLLEINVQLKRAATLANMPHVFILFQCAYDFQLV